MQIVRIEVPKALLSLVRLAQLLETVEAGGRPDAGQYRALVQRLQQELQAQSGHPELGGLLDHFPAAAQLYENLRYEAAGLCRRPLELAAATEAATQELMQRLRPGAR